MKQHIVILTGAGMSADSGLKTFRDANGLWEGHDVMSVASPEGFAANPSLVLEFYNQRRRQLLKAWPNEGHKALATLEAHYNVHIITQNVDDLHERAGSSQVLHLHGELLKVRSTGDERLVLDWREDLNLGQNCEKGYQLRPHIVWFGEEVPLLMYASELTATADILIIIGTSMQVYPAAGLVHYAPRGTPIYFIDPRPAIGASAFPNLKIIADTAASGVPGLAQELIARATSG
jgi:NAD-dependent deacetylase